MAQINTSQSARGPKKKNVQRGNTEKRPEKNVLCTSSKEGLMYVMKRTSYVRLEKNVLCRSWIERLIYVLKTSFSSPSFFFLPHSLGNILMYVMCYQLHKIENNNYQFPKFPIKNCIFAQENLSFICNYLTYIKEDLHSQLFLTIQPKHLG